MINGKLEGYEIYEVLLDEFGAVNLIDEIFNYFGSWVWRTVCVVSLAIMILSLTKRTKRAKISLATVCALHAVRRYVPKLA